MFQQWEGFNPAYLSYFMELAKAFHHSLSKPDYISAQAILRKMISMLQKEDRDNLMGEYNKMRDKIAIDVTTIEKSDGLSSIKTAAKVEAISHELLQVFEAVMDILHRDDAFKLKYHLVEGVKE